MNNVIEKRKSQKITDYYSAHIFIIAIADSHDSCENVTIQLIVKKYYNKI